MPTIPFHKMLVAEAVGTFCLVFAGTSAIVVNADGAVSHVGVAMTFGLVVFAMIAAVGDVSGAHLNPAVTIGFWIARRFPGRCVPLYILSQIAGSLLASVTVRLLFPTHSTLGATLPAGPWMQAWALEFLLTAGLMLVILSVSTGAREKGITAGLAIGGVVALEALFAGPVTGASMNPARSLAPALIAGQVASLWIYLTATIAGAAVAVLVCSCMREEGCCCSPKESCA